MSDARIPRIAYGLLLGTGVLDWARRDRGGVGRKRLQRFSDKPPGFTDGGHELRGTWSEELAVLHALLVAEVAGSGIPFDVLESCLRCEYRRDG